MHGSGSHCKSSSGSREFLAFFTSILALTMIVACGTSETPEEIARGFWNAMQLGDQERAATFVTGESLRLIDDVPSNDLEKVLFGEVLKNENTAIVRTSMVTRENDIELNLVFHTQLVLEAGQWKVDLIATQQEVTRATFAAGMKLIGEAIGQGIEEFGAALEQGAAEVRAAVRDAIDELRKHKGERL